MWYILFECKRKTSQVVLVAPPKTHIADRFERYYTVKYETHTFNSENFHGCILFHAPSIRGFSYLPYAPFSESQGLESDKDELSINHNLRFTRKSSKRIDPRKLSQLAIRCGDVKNRFGFVEGKPINQFLVPQASMFRFINFSLLCFNFANTLVVDMRLAVYVEPNKSNKSNGNSYFVQNKEFGYLGEDKFLPKLLKVQSSSANTTNNNIGRGGLLAFIFAVKFGNQVEGGCFQFRKSMTNLSLLLSHVADSVLEGQIGIQTFHEGFTANNAVLFIEPYVFW
jgi:hypothetical protein